MCLLARLLSYGITVVTSSKCSMRGSPLYPAKWDVQRKIKSSHAEVSLCAGTPLESKNKVEHPSEQGGSLEVDPLQRTSSLFLLPRAIAEGTQVRKA